MSKKPSTRLCPICKSPVVWALTFSKPGSKGIARCTNSPENSTFDLIADGITREFCSWEGITIRKPDGTVEVLTKEDTRKHGRKPQDIDPELLK